MPLARLTASHVQNLMNAQLKAGRDPEVHGYVYLFVITNATDEPLDVGGLMQLLRENISASPDGSPNLTRLEEQLLHYSTRIRFSDDLTLLAAHLLK